MVSDLFEGCHGNANVVQIFDVPIQFLSCFIHKGKDLLHLRLIFSVTQGSVVFHPTLGFNSQRQLQIDYNGEIKEVKIYLKLQLSNFKLALLMVMMSKKHYDIYYYL